MNVKIKIVFLFALVLMFLPSQGYAESYKYKDSNGVSHYTDNLHEVPEAQRPNVEIIKEADDALTPAQRYRKQQRERAARLKAQKRSGETYVKKKKPAYSARQLAQLKKKKVALEQERTALVKEQQALFKFNIKLADETRIKAHKRKVVKLNKRIRAYENKRQLFELKVAKNQG
ncbi:DUF4124 domain-containing protein [Desulfococcaceae bacterium HSG9]|nr:DUF4124 domain-containing protein [Desulfococcaceae bacterium HSG9]